MVEKHEDWKWSYYLTGTDGVVEIESDWIGAQE
jgi:hypothetical protein